MSPGSRRYSSGFSVMEMMATAVITLTADLSSKPHSPAASAPRMKENSPTWLKEPATSTAIRIGLRSSSTLSHTVSGLKIIVKPSMASTSGSCSTMPCQSKDMPTDTKKSTAKASRIGRASLAARAANRLCPSTMPERKAPNSMDAPNTCEESTAMPMANTSTASVNISPEALRAK